MNNEATSIKETRNIPLDVLRIIAVLAVVMVHTSATFVLTYDAHSTEFFIGNIFDSISRLGVSFFVMISGALMLDENKEITIKSIARRNIKKVVFLLCLWSALYAALYQVVIPAMSHETIVFSEIIKAFITGHYHMWYLYMVIGLYIITPFLRLFVCKKNSDYVLRFIGISLCIQFTQPVLAYLSQISDIFKSLTQLVDMLDLDFFCGYTAYYLAGWYIVHVGLKRKWHNAALYIAGLASIVLTIAYVCFTGDYTNGYSSMSILTFLYSSGAFLLIYNRKHAFDKTGDKIIVLSKLSFGVYILHPVLRDIIDKILPYNRYPLLYLLGFYAILITLSYAVSYVMAKLPILRKTIRM